MTAYENSIALEELVANVRAQANVRIKVGLPVMFVIVLVVLWHGTPYGPSGREACAWLSAVYACYCGVTLWLARHTTERLPSWIIDVTAVLDPLMLTGWLVLLGEAGDLFVSFYLFTMLGFGFRIGSRPMRICQVTAILGYLIVILFVPEAKSTILTAASNLVLLIIVPVYATVLIKKLRDARIHAEHESQAKSQLLANVSHDLRTPLAGIMASAQLIAEDADAAANSQRAETIICLVKELISEINDLLDSAKYESVGGLKLESAPFEIAGLFEFVSSALAPAAIAKGIKLEFQVDEYLTQPVVGDAHYLGRVINNIVGNAVKFTDKGHVTVSAKLLAENADSYNVHFSVQDTGIGIASEMHDKIFEPFVQASTGTTRKYGGTGLGMSIANQIVTLMGGKLELESELGKGTLFYFDLRLPKAERREVAGQGEPENQIVFGKRILIVDDNATNTKLLKQLLERDHHQVTTAESGEEALCLLNQINVDVVFLDFNMEDMDGISVLNLYQFARTDAAPVLFLTADTTPSTSAKLQASGAAGVLYKPITSEELRNKLAGLFQKEAVPAPIIRPRGRALQAVSVQYIDQSRLEELRSIAPNSGFVNEVICAALSDIEEIYNALQSAIENENLEEARYQAHTIKGVGVNVGAVRLNALADRLMSLTAPDLREQKMKWLEDIKLVKGETVNSLKEIADIR